MIQAGLVKLNYAQALGFDSNGTNTGLEFRYYSRGRAGTFSLGLAFEKTYIKLLLNGTAKQDYLSGASAEVDVNANVTLSPFTTQRQFPLGVRGEQASHARSSPSASASLPCRGRSAMPTTGLTRPAPFSSRSPGARWRPSTIWRRRRISRSPNIFVLFQLDFGLKAELAKGLYLSGEAGIWNGFILRGGISYRSFSGRLGSQNRLPASA